MSLLGDNKSQQRRDSDNDCCRSKFGALLCFVTVREDLCVFIDMPKFFFRQLV